MELLLGKNEILDLGKNQCGMSIICQEGSCWLTQTGDSRDHILHPGDRFHVQSKGQLLLTASGSCRIKLLANSNCQRNNSPWRQLCAGNL